MTHGHEAPDTAAPAPRDLRIDTTAPRRGRPWTRLGLTLLALTATVLSTGVVEAGRPRIARNSKRTTARASAAPAPGRGLVWHVESFDGTPMDSRLGDEPINPASVTKMATSLWALEKLGPDHRFATRFATRGPVEPKGGELQGDLVIEGGGDPDFQPENAILVAKELNDRGIERVRGALIVDHAFWIGYEDGSQGRDPDPSRRALTMGARVRQAMDPQRWNGLIRRVWHDVAVRRGWNPQRPPRLVVAGPTREMERVSGTPLAVHISRPLVNTLHRINAYSINDMERVGANLGSPSDMAEFLASRWNLSKGAVSFQTTSGLGNNRISPRQITTLVRDLKLTCDRLHIAIEAVLPTVGCDPGTVAHFFGKIANGPAATSIVGKTGTLTSTDGGVSVFAGLASTAKGDVVFAVAEPRAAGRLRLARYKQQEWLLDLIAKNGGPAARTCGTPVTGPDDGAVVGPPSLLATAKVEPVAPLQLDLPNPIRVIEPPENLLDTPAEPPPAEPPSAEPPPEESKPAPAPTDH